MERASTPVTQVLVLKDADANRMHPGRFIALTPLNQRVEGACPTRHVLAATSVLALVSFLAPVIQYARIGSRLAGRFLIVQPAGDRSLWPDPGILVSYLQPGGIAQYLQAPYLYCLHKQKGVVACSPVSMPMT